MPTTHELMPHQKARAIVNNVTQALADVDQAFTLLIGAKQRLAATLGNGPGYYHALWTGSISDYTLDRDAKDAQQHITQNAWRYIVRQTGMTAYMTEARQKELMAQLDKGDFPALTVENILGTLSALADRTPELVYEAAREVFDWLRPRQPWGVGALKTNQKWKVGYKVIVGAVVDPSWSGKGFQISTYREANMRTLGNVLSLLDGTGVERYPDDLVTRLKTGLQASWETVDRYGRYKAYRNGNLHVAFIRHDLIDKLNALASDGTLAPEPV